MHQKFLDAHVPKLFAARLDDMNELEVIRKDAIRLAAVVVNISKKYKPFQEKVRVLGHRALNTRQLSD